MSELLASVRKVLIALAALTLFASVATQMLGAIFGYAAHFGEHTPPWFGFPLYEPWRFLEWGLGLAPVRPWIAFLCIVLATTFVMAAFAVMVLAGLVAPSDLPQFEIAARVHKLGQSGPTRAIGGQWIGAGRRASLCGPDRRSRTHRRCIAGGVEYLDRCAGLRRWAGAPFEARASRHRSLRSGRADNASYNPLFALRAGDQAWEDARRLAAPLPQSGGQGAVDVFALLMVDQMLAAPIEKRLFAALRRRLADLHRVLAELCGTGPVACNQLLSEMTRITRLRARQNAQRH